MYSVMFFNLICRIEYEVQTQRLTEKKPQNYKISKKAIQRKENVCINNSLFLILV